MMADPANGTAARQPLSSSWRWSGLEVVFSPTYLSGPAAAEVIDDDLGRSGGGIARPGFERLIAAICAGNVGAVLAIEASRLARRRWLTRD
jgi:hypothetical protein